MTYYTQNEVTNLEGFQYFVRQKKDTLFTYTENVYYTVEVIFGDERLIYIHKNGYIQRYANGSWWLWKASVREREWKTSWVPDERRTKVLPDPDEFNLSSKTIDGLILDSPIPLSAYKRMRKAMEDLGWIRW